VFPDGDLWLSFNGSPADLCVRERDRRIHPQASPMPAPASWPALCHGLGDGAVSSRPSGDLLHKIPHVRLDEVDRTAHEEEVRTGCLGLRCS